MYVGQLESVVFCFICVLNASSMCLLVHVRARVRVCVRACEHVHVAAYFLVCLMCSVLILEKDFATTLPTLVD